MRIVYAGTVDFSSHCLREIIAQGGDVVGVFTLDPDKQKHYNADFDDVGAVAREHGIPVHIMRKISDPETEDLIIGLEPDVIFVFGLSQLIKPRVLDAPTLGCVGSHPALLPKNRGRHPLIWPVVNGEKESGLTFFFMTPGVDDGDILWQERFEIAHEDDAATLYQKVKDLATQAIGEFLPALQEGTYTRTPQDHAAATVCRKRGEADGEIDWSRDALTTYNLTRALAKPYIGAHTFAPDGSRLIIWRSAMAEPIDGPGAPGDVLHVAADRFTVRAGDGALDILDWESDWTPVRGARLGARQQNTHPGAPS